MILAMLPVEATKTIVITSLQAICTRIARTTTQGKSSTGVSGLRIFTTQRLRIVAIVPSRRRKKPTAFVAMMSGAGCALPLRNQEIAVPAVHTHSYRICRLFHAADVRKRGTRWKNVVWRLVAASNVHSRAKHAALQARMKTQTSARSALKEHSICTKPAQSCVGRSSYAVINSRQVPEEVAAGVLCICQYGKILLCQRCAALCYPQ